MIIRHFNVVKIDSKGRVIVPHHIRNYLGLKVGTELIVVDNENGELKMFPLVSGKTAYVKLMLTNISGSMVKLMDILSEQSVGILISTCRTIEKGKLAEWTAILDLSQCDGMSAKILKKKLSSIKAVRSVEVEEK